MRQNESITIISLLQKNHSMKRSSIHTLHIMYPLKFLCKQYTNQSLSESLLEGISSSCPWCHIALSCGCFKPGLREIRSGEPQTGWLPSCSPYVSAVFCSLTVKPGSEKAPQGRASTSLLCVSCISHLAILFPTPFPSRKPLASLHPLPAPHSPESPLPTLHTVPSRDRNK